MFNQIGTSSSSRRAMNTLFRASAFAPRSFSIFILIFLTVLRRIALRMRKELINGINVRKRAAESKKCTYH